MSEAHEVLEVQASQVSATQVSIIVPVYNDVARLQSCLRALTKQSWPSARFEIVVVDNNSEQDVASVAHAHGVTLLREPTPGSYAARNTGIAAAKGEILAFTDADCLPSEHWLERAVEALLAARTTPSDPVIVGGPVKLFPRDADAPSWVETYELTTAFDQRRYVQEQHYSVTANCVTTRATFEQVGLFNAELRSAGDKEWGQRAYAQGAKLVYAPGAIVHHPARHDLTELLSKRRRQTGGMWRAAQNTLPRWAASAKMLAQVTRPPAERLVKAWKNSPDQSPLGRLKSVGRVAAVAGALSAVCSVEVCRLHLGKVPER
ncbi:MAG TPA: glycosyltransferase [Polyangiaceae bacterium]|jgi:glycosyltransferase involved in cell wall biosynthesis|nr:glycosyltransferase [Polyangiaceae bacterium]